MASVTLDLISFLEADERDGMLQRLVRVAYVSGISGITDYSVLTSALDEAGVPAYGDTLTENTANNEYYMRLVERNPRLIDKDKVEIQLVYESILNSPQFLHDPRANQILGSVRCSIQQKTSSTNKFGDEVTVQYTYPADDSYNRSGTDEQGVEFQYYEAQRSVVIEGIKIEQMPWLIANRIVGRVNSVPFSGEAVRTWLCTACNWRPGWQGRAVSNNHYYMDFEFQFDADTWDPVVRWIDPNTGRPPKDLVQDVGIKTIEKLEEVDFEDIIGAPIQGG